MLRTWSVFSRMAELNLMHNKIGPTAVAQLIPIIKACISLTVLDLSHNELVIPPCLSDAANDESELHFFPIVHHLKALLQAANNSRISLLHLVLSVVLGLLSRSNSAGKQ